MEKIVMAYLIFFLALLLDASRRDARIEENCDRIEYNVVYSENGKVAYKQYIIYDFNITGWEVVTWVMAEPKSSDMSFEKIGDKYVLTYTDQRLVRRLTTKIYLETHTRKDRERENKHYLREDQRRPLAKNELQS